MNASPSDVRSFVLNALRAAGTADDCAQSVTRALLEASLRGIDSHGIRLLLHYASVTRSGRINPAPRLSFSSSGPATGVVDGDNGFGHFASYFAVSQSITLARQAGIGAVAVINSSHFGAAGCYVTQAAEHGMAALCACNSDSFVLPHDGVQPFHGTNPLAFAAPVPGASPFLIDMATSVIPWNRVQDLRMRSEPLPPDVAVDRFGEPTLDPEQAVALLPIGGTQHGYKGAALGGVVEILSAVMTGMAVCNRLLPMAGPDFHTPRRLGHFFIAIDPARFVTAELYEEAMTAYLADLRNQPARPGQRVMAAGDREWTVRAQRLQAGIPISAPLLEEFRRLAERLHIPPLARE